MRRVRLPSLVKKAGVATVYVRFGSEADMQCKTARLLLPPIADKYRRGWNVRYVPAANVAPHVSEPRENADMIVPVTVGREARQQLSPALIFLAGIVGSVHVRDAKWSVAANLNDCRHFGERIMIGIRREYDETARTKLTGSLLVQLVAGSEMKFTRDNRYTFDMRMFVGWNLISCRHF